MTVRYKICIEPQTLSTWINDYFLMLTEYEWNIQYFRLYFILNLGNNISLWFIRIYTLLIFISDGQLYWSFYNLSIHNIYWKLFIIGSSMILAVFINWTSILYKVYFNSLSAMDVYLSSLLIKNQ